MDTVINLATDKEYQRALKKVESFGFHQREKIGDLFPTVYILKNTPKYRRYHPYLEIAWGWFLIVSGIWPAEFIPITRYLVQLVEKEAPLSPAVILVWKFAAEYPPAELQALASDRQSKAHAGDYEDLLRNNDIYNAHNEQVQANPEVHKHWAMVNAIFDVSQFANEIGVVRRYIIGERGFRVDWKFDPKDPESVVRTLVTLLAYRHDLYGFQHMAPLVSKFTANPTGFGTVMMAPKYQATDVARDLNRKTFGLFPKAYGVARKGAKALVAKREREDEAIRTYSASLRAGDRLGADRRRFIIQEAGLPPRTEDRKIRKLIVMAKKLLGVKEA